ncbi:YbgI/family dinuclear metal center protein [Allomyces macrogynus ATCC 38327]|uniref:YbgI/family dinuclear metal center protein n=1 Tax=Allomyces macrogynus (strain ATCC 38327) TaxID=578462 RepID=A0A0L0SYM5_ALLM3|nr:YbgI/family dinuclear metal center protein [Allomyces macrogynus ATCC 38327]|eukprot:KNE67490.1 YbgI/family dinuclear metal center protein [Allomyces macrogynus ATCC 38327]
MALLRQVQSSFHKFAPLHLAETAWDNVGVLVEAPYPRQEADTVFLTIDLTPQVLEEALQLGNVGVIVAYHPTIFRGWKKLNLATDGDAESIKQEVIMKLIARGISLYCPHTSLDAAQGGINDWLAKGLEQFGIKSTAPITPSNAANPGPEGSGRIIELTSPQSLPDVIAAIKKHLNLPFVRVATAPRNHKISSIAMCAGSGASVFSRAATRPDLLWTGEMGHHEVLGAVQTGSHVVLCEHTNTERGYLSAVLKPRLERDAGLKVVVSTVDRDPLVVQ